MWKWKFYSYGWWLYKGTVLSSTNDDGSSSTYRNNYVNCLQTITFRHSSVFCVNKRECRGKKRWDIYGKLRQFSGLLSFIHQNSSLTLEVQTGFKSDSWWHFMVFCTGKFIPLKFLPQHLPNPKHLLTTRHKIKDRYIDKQTVTRHTWYTFKYIRERTL